jgi:hypothetical protein
MPLIFRPRQNAILDIVALTRRRRLFDRREEFLFDEILLALWRMSLVRVTIPVRVGAMDTAFWIGRVAGEPVHAVDFVDGDLAEEFDGDGVGVDGEFVA